MVNLFSIYIENQYFPLCLFEMISIRWSKFSSDGTVKHFGGKRGSKVGPSFLIPFAHSEEKKTVGLAFFNLIFLPLFRLLPFIYFLRSLALGLMLLFLWHRSHLDVASDKRKGWKAGRLMPQMTLFVFTKKRQPEKMGRRRRRERKRRSNEKNSKEEKMRKLVFFAPAVPCQTFDFF